MGKELIEEKPDDFTNISGEGVPTEKKKRGPKAGSKKTSFSDGELIDKTFFICKLIAGIFKYDFTYREKDFSSEGQALGRMCDKFPIVGTIITYFDPIYYIGSIVNKFSACKRQKKEEQPPVDLKPTQENVYSVQ